MLCGRMAYRSSRNSTAVRRDRRTEHRAAALRYSPARAQSRKHGGRAPSARCWMPDYVTRRVGLRSGDDVRGTGKRVATQCGTRRFPHCVYAYQMAEKSSNASPPLRLSHPATEYRAYVVEESGTRPWLIAGECSKECDDRFGFLAVQRRAQLRRSHHIYCLT